MAKIGPHCPRFSDLELCPIGAILHNMLHEHLEKAGISTIALVGLRHSAHQSRYING